MIYKLGNQKIVFIHIPSTGGSTIGYYLEDMGFVPQPFKNPYPINNQHLTYNELQRAVRKTDADEAMDMEDYFTFTFVRNPYARVVALWQSRGEGADFKSWIMDAQKKLEDDLYAYDAHLRPQADFISAHVNRIGRTENLTGDFLSILSDMGFYKKELPDIPFDKQNATDPLKHNADYHKMYDDESREVALQLYYTDLSQFNYRFEVND